jgi:hypothetical protein
VNVRIGTPAQPLPSDAVLVARLRDRDEAAFGIVLDAWSDGLLRLARSFVSTHDSAAEVVQETWLAVIQGIERFEGRSSLKTWVYRILVNIAKSRGVKESRTIPWSSLAGAGGATGPPRTRGPRWIRPGSEGPAIRTRATGGSSRRPGRRRSQRRSAARSARRSAPRSTACRSGSAW